MRRGPLSFPARHLRRRHLQRGRLRQFGGDAGLYGGDVGFGAAEGLLSNAECLGDLFIRSAVLRTTAGALRVTVTRNVQPQDLHRRSADRYRAPALRRLGLLELPAAPVPSRPDQRPPDVHRPGPQVDIIPLQREVFFRAHPTVQRQHGQRGMAVRLRRRQEPPGLLWREGLHLVLLLARQVHHRRDIMREKAPPDRLLQGRREDRMGVPDCARRQVPGAHVGVEPLDVQGRDVAQPLRAERRADVADQDGRIVVAPVRLRRRGRAASASQRSRYSSTVIRVGSTNSPRSIWRRIRPVQFTWVAR